MAPLRPAAKDSQTITWEVEEICWDTSSVLIRENNSSVTSDSLTVLIQVQVSRLFPVSTLRSGPDWGFGSGIDHYYYYYPIVGTEGLE